MPARRSSYWVSSGVASKHRFAGQCSHHRMVAWRPSEVQGTVTEMVSRSCVLAATLCEATVSSTSLHTSLVGARFLQISDAGGVPVPVHYSYALGRRGLKSLWVLKTLSRGQSQQLPDDSDAEVSRKRRAASALCAMTRQNHARATIR